MRRQGREGAVEGADRGPGRAGDDDRVFFGARSHGLSPRLSVRWLGGWAGVPCRCRRVIDVYQVCREMPRGKPLRQSLAAEVRGRQFAQGFRRLTTFE
uniref:Uncharacterized protein n=1 Tax=Tolypothrix bouteillei VB521301 TaxID=1479485 RepID=A0A0C1NAL1_9CYAN